MRPTNQLRRIYELLSQTLRERAARCFVPPGPFGRDTYNSDLAIEKELPIERVYYMDAGKKAFVRDIELLEKGTDYCVEEKVERKDMVVDIQGFYGKLKSEEELDDDDI